MTLLTTDESFYFSLLSVYYHHDRALSLHCASGCIISINVEHHAMNIPIPTGGYSPKWGTRKATLSVDVLLFTDLYVSAALDVPLPNERIK